MAVNNFFQVLRARESNVESALINFEAPRGLGVQYDPTKGSAFGDGTAEFKKATGTRAFFLERDVLTEIPDRLRLFPQRTFLTPEVIGNRVSARLPEEIIVEGLDLVLTSGTGAISANTAADTALGLDRGKWRVKQGGDELVGYLREQMEVQDPANVCAIRVEIPQ